MIEEQRIGLMPMAPEEAEIVRKEFKKIRVWLAVFCLTMPVWISILAWGILINEIGLIVGGAIPFVMFVFLIIGFSSILRKYGRDLNENMKVSHSGFISKKESVPLKNVPNYTILIGERLFDLSKAQFDTVSVGDLVEIQITPYSKTVVNIIQQTVPKSGKRKKKTAA